MKAGKEHTESNVSIQFALDRVKEQFQETLIYRYAFEELISSLQYKGNQIYEIHEADLYHIQEKLNTELGKRFNNRG